MYCEINFEKCTDIFHKNNIYLQNLILLISHSIKMILKYYFYLSINYNWYNTMTAR